MANDGSLSPSTWAKPRQHSLGSTTAALDVGCLRELGSDPLGALAEILDRRGEQLEEGQSLRQLLRIIVQLDRGLEGRARRRIGAPGGKQRMRFNALDEAARAHDNSATWSADEAVTAGHDQVCAGGNARRQSRPIPMSSARQSVHQRRGTEQIDQR